MMFEPSDKLSDELARLDQGISLWGAEKEIEDEFLTDDEEEDEDDIEDDDEEEDEWDLEEDDDE